jgi:glycosyltransferase involved in cell wall biosynthesis
VSDRLVSVVTIARNDLAGLQRTWESLVSQDHGDFGWIVVDGASSDSTVPWLKTLDDPRVSWISEPDAGIYDALNKGTARVHEDSLVVFMNAGDRFASDQVLEVVTTHQREHGWRWGYGAMRIVDASGALVGFQFPNPFRLGDLRLGMQSIGHQSAYFMADLLAEVGPYDPTLGIEADQQLMYRAAKISSPGVIPDIVAEFLAGGVSYGGRPDDFVQAARRMRAADGDLVGGNTVVDGVATTALRAQKWARHLGSRAVRRAGLR